MKIDLTFKQVTALAAELQEVGKENFLRKRKAIKVRKGEWYVMEYAGLKATEAYEGYFYESDIPYMFWSDVLKQVEYFLWKREQKQKNEEKSLEKTANEQHTN